MKFPPAFHRAELTAHVLSPFQEQPLWGVVPVMKNGGPGFKKTDIKTGILVPVKYTKSQNLDGFSYFCS